MGLPYFSRYVIRYQLRRWRRSELPGRKKKKKKDRWAGGGKATTFRKYPPSSAGNESNSGVSGTHCSLETPFAAEHRPPVRRGQPGISPTAGSSGASKSFTAPGRPLPFTLPAFSVLCPRPAESGCDLATPPSACPVLHAPGRNARQEAAGKLSGNLGAGVRSRPVPIPLSIPIGCLQGEAESRRLQRERGRGGRREGRGRSLPASAAPPVAQRARQRAEQHGGLRAEGSLSLIHI